MRSATVFAFLSAAILIACGQTDPPLSPTPTGSAAAVGSGSPMVTAARKSTAKFVIHVFDVVTGDYVDGAVVTAVGSDGVPQSDLTTFPHGHVDLEVSKDDATFDVRVTKDGYCPKDVVVTNDPPRWLWIGIQPGC
jgi:hypothetical protein